MAEGRWEPTSIQEGCVPSAEAEPTNSWTEPKCPPVDCGQLLAGPGWGSGGRWVALEVPAHGV